MLSARTEISDIRTQLRSVFCEATDLHEVDDGVWVLASPFIYGDGDGLPVYIENTKFGWSLTDGGGALARWSIDYPDYELAEPRRQRLANVVSSFGAELQDETIRLNLPRGHTPDGFDIAYFIRIVAAADVLPRIQGVRTVGFRPQIHGQIIASVRPETVALDHFVERDMKRLWPIEIFLQTEHDPVLALTVSNSRQAEEATSTLQRHYDWGTVGTRLVMRDISGRASDRSLARLDEVIAGEGEIVTIDSGSPSSLNSALRRCGAQLVAA